LVLVQRSGSGSEELDVCFGRGEPVIKTDQSTEDLQEALFPAIADPELRPARTALLIVDMTKGQAHPDYGLGALAQAKGLEDTLRGYYERIGAMVPNIVRLREAVGALGGEVIYLRTVAQTNQLTELNSAYKEVGQCPGICAIGSTEAEFLDDLQPSEREIVVDKISVSPFNSTPLDQILRNLGTDVLIVTGVRTNEAIELTAHGAGDRGYWTIVVSDACAAASNELHEAILRHVGFLLIKVKSTQDVLRMLLHKDWGQCS
jgi:nicotinamidase-related amidase